MTEQELAFESENERRARYAEMSRRNAERFSELLHIPGDEPAPAQEPAAGKAQGVGSAREAAPAIDSETARAALSRLADVLDHPTDAAAVRWALDALGLPGHAKPPELILATPLLTSEATTAATSAAPAPVAPSPSPVTPGGVRRAGLGMLPC